ncbi:MAG: alpha/beta hydrolase [Pirellulales bacterium]
MHYQIRGEGKPAVYVHPIVSHGGSAPRLTNNRQWICVDLQGHGRTLDIDRPMTVEQHADDIAGLLKHLEIAEADFFGDSFGGVIAVTLAVRHPKLVRKIATYGSPLTPLPKEIVEVVKSDSNLMRWEREEFQKVAPDSKQWEKMFSRSLKSGAEWKGFSAIELKQITAPVLIACGDHDLIPIERCIELSRLIPNAQLAVIPDASHFVLFSEPNKLLPVLVDFFDAPAKKTPLSSMQSGFYPGETR